MDGRRLAARSQPRSCHETPTPTRKDRASKGAPPAHGEAAPKPKRGGTRAAHAPAARAHATADPAPAKGKPSSLLDTRVVYCGDNLEQLAKLPGACVDLIYIDPPFNSNRNYEVFWGETKEKRSFEDRHESTRAYVARAAWRWPACSRRPALS